MWVALFSLTIKIGFLHSFDGGRISFGSEFYFGKNSCSRKANEAQLSGVVVAAKK